MSTDKQYCRFRGCGLPATKGRYCDRHYSKKARIKIQAEQDRLAAEAKAKANAEAGTKAEAKVLEDAKRQKPEYSKKLGIFASIQNFWKKVFAPKTQPSQPSDGWVVRFRKGDQYIYINLGKYFGEENASNAHDDPKSAIVDDPQSAGVESEVFQQLFAHFLRTNSQKKSGLSHSERPHDFMEESEMFSSSKAGRQKVLLKYFAEIAEILAGNFRELKIASESQLATAEAVPLDQAVKDYNVERQSAPENTKKSTDLASALDAAGYKKTMTRPTDQKSAVDSIVQAVRARQICSTENFFETGEKNPERILCSDNDCICTDQKPLIIGRSAYLYISQGVVNFRKTCLTLLEREIQLQQYAKAFGAGALLVDGGVANPFYLCEIGARQRGLDLSVALADAKQVAETGFAPLRPTPKSKN
jgi:hypothetical protein